MTAVEVMVAWCPPGIAGAPTKTLHCRNTSPALMRDGASAFLGAGRQAHFLCACEVALVEATGFADERVDFFGLVSLRREHGGAQLAERLVQAAQPDLVGAGLVARRVKRAQLFDLFPSQHQRTFEVG